MIRLARRVTETSEALQMVTNAYEFLTNPCEFLTKLTVTELIINLPNFSWIFANVKQTYECPCEFCECLRTPYEWNDYTTHARRTPLPMFRCVDFTRQAILNSRFALIIMYSLALAAFCLHFVWMNSSKSLRIYCDCLRKCCENNKNMLS